MLGFLSLLARSVLSFVRNPKKAHRDFRATCVAYFQTREIVKTFRVAHAQELALTPINQWPLVKQKHAQELSAIEAGNFGISDRRSWQWPWLPQNVTRFSMPVAKFLPYSLRRMSRTPIPRRAINLIKSAIITQEWDVRPIKDIAPIDEFQEQRIRIAKELFNHPNNVDSFQTFVEMGLEDLMVPGAFVAEMRLTPDPERPIKLWAVNAESLRVFAAWSESTPDMPHWAQMTGLKGERGAILFYDDEILYIKDNPSTDSPYGLGRMEVAFQAVNGLLGIHAMAQRAGSDQIHKTWMWWEQPQAAANYDIIRRHIQNEMEGQARVSMIGGMKKPEVLEIQPTKEEDLLLNWQEMLIRVIANAFDLSPMALGLERDVNRSTSESMDKRDFGTAVAPVAMRLQESFTRVILHTRLDWTDLEFAFPNLTEPDNQTKMDLNSRLYVTNSVTPNEIRASLGITPSANPFYDLNQFECQLLMAQAGLDLQDRNAARATVRQQQAVQQQPRQTEENAEEKSMVPVQAAAYRQLVSGTNYTVGEIMGMKIETIAWLLTSGQLPKPSVLLRNLGMQDAALQTTPDGSRRASLLQTLGEEVRAFLEAVAEEERQNPVKPITDIILNRWRIVQMDKFNRANSRERDMQEWMYENTSQAGVPGRNDLHKASRNKKAGVR